MLALSCFCLCLAAEPLDYDVADPDLKVIRIDSVATESYIGIRLDSMGRIFVGGREALFVYEPDGQGGYGPRRELFRWPNHTWVNDIEIRGHDIYVMTVSALYILPDATVKRENIQAKRLIWGVPMGHVHQCLHALAWGPEGDLYFSMGDPVWYYGDFNRPDHWGHWTFFCQPEGTRMPYTGTGGVFRCRPDGSNLRVVARGLRNACGLAFDRDWSLFTNDNDHESMPADYVPGRLLHVTPHAFFSWPRAWMPHKQPDRSDLLETLNPILGRYVPVGQAYYDEAYFPEQYRNNLLVARWCTREIARYPLQQRGASYQAEEKPFLVGKNTARPMGVCVGRGGRVFATIAYMAHNDTSPVYKSDLIMITRRDDSEKHPFEAYDVATLQSGAVAKDLSTPSWERRSRAHLEWLRRPDYKPSFIELYYPPLSNPGTKPEFADRHTPWLRDGTATAEQIAKRALPGGPTNWRWHALRALSADDQSPAAIDAIIRNLDDPDPRLKLAALHQLFSRKVPIPAVQALTASPDTYIRQTAAMLLAEKAKLDDVAKLCNDANPALRLGGVLAAGFRLTIPPATSEIPKELPLQPLRNGEPYLVEFPDGKVDLRPLGRIGNFTVAEHWNARPRSQNQERLFAMLLDRLGDADDKVKVQAAHFLYLLNDSRSEPIIAKLRRENEEKKLATAAIQPVKKAWVIGPFPDGVEGFAKTHSPEKGVVDLTWSGSGLSWKEATSDRLFDFAKLFGPCDRSSFYSFIRLESATKGRIHLLIGSDDGVKVWHNGREVWRNEVARGALPFQDVVSLELEPGSNDILLRVRNETGSCGLYLHYRALGNVAARMPDKLDGALLAERLKSAVKESPIPPEFFQVDWNQAWKTGDPAKGRELFGKLACAKCHAISAEAPVVGGPSLADSGKRFNVAYLVESILLPNKQVSPVFRATAIATTKDQVLTGLVLNETAEFVELILGDASRRKVPKGEIGERKLQDVSPMPGGMVKTPEELRDLLAYLLSDRPQPP